MSTEYEARFADNSLHAHLAHQIGDYLSDPNHDSEFGAVLYSSSVAEFAAKEWDDYPPEGHGYPSHHHDR
ncbi:hypothetical protein [Streptomyces abikoensis]|uniref:hypothetical protein n=1 Tax=Streptomyces abikoensis TaxID=97398 RepID=UPI001678D4F1|nr:hypothetical protein [Streptomyces abikoensis]GGP55389.1 hypothetical protein GCM10010214_30700 [Streptomyces abikoensis]